MRSTWLGTVCLLGVLFARSLPADSGCTGMGTTAGISLICSGTCSQGRCESRSDGMDGRGAFSYCGCLSGDYDTCCTVVLRDGRARKRGTCPPCGGSGLCTLQDNPEGELNEPVCDPKKAARSETLRR